MEASLSVEAWALIGAALCAVWALSHAFERMAEEQRHSEPPRFD
jgi:hypothetical protein